jgi:hypothetical protein
MPPTKHSEHGASIAARWLACPGSVKLSRGQPNYDNIHSITGTAAHTLAEWCFDDEQDPHHFVGREIPVKDNTLGITEVEVDEDMAAAVKVYTDYVHSRVRPLDAQWWRELEVDLSSLNPPEGVELYGTSDCPLYLPAEKLLEVVDYKHGSGVVVEVKGNVQLRYYALGVYLALNSPLPVLDIETVRITIVQPRAQHPDGPIRSEDVSVADLLAFGQYLVNGARITQRDDAPLVPGSHCRFCPASPICPAQREQTQALARVTFADMPVDLPPEPETLPPDVLADILTKLPILEDWARAVRQHAYHMAERGEAPEGFKLVAGRPTRRWLDEADVKAYLVDEHGLDVEELHTLKLKSPAQIEKLIGKKNLPDHYYEKKSSTYKLVPLHDPRPAVAALSAGEVFAALPPGDAE